MLMISEQDKHNKYENVSLDYFYTENEHLEKFLKVHLCKHLRPLFKNLW